MRFWDWFVGSLTLLTLIPQVAVMLVLPLCIKRCGKRWISLIGMVIYLIASLLLFINPQSITIVYISTFVRGLGLAPAGLCQFAFFADIVEHSHYHAKIRTEGLINSSVSFANKIGIGMGTVLVTSVMAFGGYDGATTVQSASALSSIESLFLYGPIFVAVGCIIFLAIYDLDQKYDDIVEKIKVRENNAD